MLDVDLRFYGIFRESLCPRLLRPPTRARRRHVAVYYFRLLVDLCNTAIVLTNESGLTFGLAAVSLVRRTTSSELERTRGVRLLITNNFTLRARN
uniref:Uncharacterized protein n=1 Tax=Hyaloperonospora arabidopsidis (strain Emoy2) TaxID=559515 RepID=M4BLC6_HYAAE